MVTRDHSHLPYLTDFPLQPWRSSPWPFYGFKKLMARPWIHFLEKYTYKSHSASKFQKIHKMSQPIHRPSRTVLPSYGEPLETHRHLSPK